MNQQSLVSTFNRLLEHNLLPPLSSRTKNEIASIFDFAGEWLVSAQQRLLVREDKELKKTIDQILEELLYPESRETDALNNITIDELLDTSNQEHILNSLKPRSLSDAIEDFNKQLIEVIDSYWAMHGWAS